MIAMREKRMIELHMRSLGLSPLSEVDYLLYAEMLENGEVTEPRALRGRVRIDGGLFSRKSVFIARNKYGLRGAAIAEHLRRDGE